MAISALEEELIELKKEVLSMMHLVQNQLIKTKEAFFTHDQGLAEEIVAKDKEVNSFDIYIDKKCEKILALYAPVAVDLRFVISSIKVNSHLERIGDNVKAVAKFVANAEKPFDKKFAEILRIQEMFDAVIDMLSDAVTAFDKDELGQARLIYKKDKLVNQINAEASEVGMPYLENKSKEELGALILVLSSVRKLERVGDLAKNVVEEILFYLDAKVLKHKTKKQEKL